jgi:hypothetical protein
VKPMQRALIALCPVAVLALASCATSHLVTQDTLQPLRRGMTQAAFGVEITIPPKSTFAVEFEEASYPVEVFDMQTGTRTETSSHWVSMYPSGGYMATSTYQVPVSEDYVFIFDEGGLMYWGFLNEMQKEDDEVVQGLAPLVVAEYQHQLKLEKEKYEKDLARSRGAK